MTTLNAYATLLDYKSWFTLRSGSTSLDAQDDAVIELLLVGASDYIERECGRDFNPRIETRYYSVPTDDPRLLRLDDDLLEVLSVTNGDGTTIPSTEYKLQPINKSPYRGIRLNGTSTYLWESDDSGDIEDVIAISGVWGCHKQYSQAWATGSTLAEELDASETGVDVTSANNFRTGQIIRCQNELCYISSMSGATLTTTRGENGSTAATHANLTAVTIWQVQTNIKMACLQIVESAYSLRAGQSSIGRVTITAAGVVIRPEEVPPMAQKTIESYRFMT